MTYEMTNTEGYTASELAILNAAHVELADGNEDAEFTKRLSEVLGNAWIPGNTLRQLVDAAWAIGV